MAPQAPASQHEAGQDYVEGRLLDGFLMLAAGGSSTPDDVVSVNLSSLQIVDVAEEDLSFFVRLDRVDVSDNQLSYEHVLQQLSSIPKLGLLSLACNAITSIQVPASSLRHLRSLDLSYNELHGDVLAQLAALPNLEHLDLSSNCISSVPPEEDLYGFQSLEELILDANDLVQFIQWRALDAAPKLRRLSMASNRIKRVKDDAPDVPGGDGVSYFPSLEELDLSSNEIASYGHLSALKLFQSLRVLNLNDNPCSQQPTADDKTLRGVTIKAWAKKPWYLEGSGCFMKRRKATEPRLKLNRQRMRRVRSMQEVGTGRRRRKGAQVGVLDESTNQLVISFPGGTQEADRTPGSRTRAVTVGSSVELPAMSSGILDDDLSEEELNQLLRERRSKIDLDFKSIVDEPRSFMRSAPFPEDDLARHRPGSASRLEDESTLMGTSSIMKRSSSNLFLTGIGEEAPEAATTPARFVKPVTVVPPPAAAASPSPTMSPIPNASAATAGTVTLPPIAPGSRGSSAGGSRSDVNEIVIQKPKMIVPDVGVREAMRALRAAAMSEYAVAV